MPGYRFFMVLLPALLLLAGCAHQPVVVFMSDFGLENEAVGLCHGAMLQVEPRLQIIDLTHQIAPYNIEQGARVLARATSFPRGTVFVAVIDPGVGTARMPIALATQAGFYFIGPNNGLFSEVIRTQGLAAAHRIEPVAVNPQWRPGTFDGRDLFAPAAAKLARMRDPRRLGPPLTPDQVIIRTFSAGTLGSDGTLRGSYIRTDEPYGNIWTDLDVELLSQAGIKPGARLQVSIGPHRFTVVLVTAFGDVPEGDKLAYINSDNRLAFAINMGDLRKELDISPGMPIVVALLIEQD